ncbi:surface-adhesin E family protein [Rhodoferax sp.]|uniref:surface-adhesin E family protein n=1 Tax=Rhodoferax sp. TaxID=50421 RepID=UPI00374D6758
MPLLLTLGCSQPVKADWLRISTSETSVFYIDSAIPPKVGNNVTVWILRDHNTAQTGEGGTYLSSKDQIEIDCAGQRVRRLYSSDHPQHMGEGELVHSEHGPMSWNDASPNTIVKRIVDVACAHS